MIKSITACCISCLFLPLVSTANLTVPLDQPAPAHPRLIVNADELDAMAQRVADGQFPHVLQWEQLREELAQPMKARPYVGDRVKPFYDSLQSQSQRARDLAIAWWITKDDRYAEEAIGFLRAWSGATPLAGSQPLMQEDGTPIPSTAMYVSRASFPMLYAADLLWNHRAFDEATRESFIGWLRQMEHSYREGILEWENSGYYNGQDYNNHLVAHVLGLAAVGSLLDDRDLLQFALQDAENPRDFAELLEGLILMEGDAVHHRERADAPPPQDGEMMDRYRHHTAGGRGLQYAYLSTALLAVTAEVYRAYGIDLWRYTAPTGENLRLPLEFYSDFYRLRDTSLKGGFYRSSNARLGQAGDSPSLFELGLRRYPQSEPLRQLVWILDRPLYSGHLLGPVLLTHGIVFPEQAGLSPREAPAEPAAYPVVTGLGEIAINENHPRLLLDRAGLDAMRTRALSGAPGWTEAWDSLRSRADAALLRKATPYLGSEPYVFYNLMLPQAQAARDLALAWWISGESTYREAAATFIRRWADASPAPGTLFPSDASANGKGMLISRSTLPLLWAYDLLAGGDALTADEEAAFKAWVRQLVPQVKDGARIWKANGYFDHQFYQNHLAGENMGLVAMALTLGDETLLEYAFNTLANDRDFLDLCRGLILMPGDTVYYREPPGALAPQAGEIIDRYRHFQLGGHYADYVTYPNRGLQYCMLSANLLAISAQMLATNGIDAWNWTSDNGESLELPFTFYAPIYANQDASLQGGFYAGETSRLTQAGDVRALFEIAASAYPQNETIASALEWPGRWTDVSILLGNEALIFGGSPDAGE